MRKQFVHTGIFLLILSVLFTFLSWYFYPKNNSPEAGILDYTAHGFLAEPENSLEAVILGDSVPLCAFSPQVIEETAGIRSYVCASTGQTLPKSETFLLEFLRRQSPKLVILEANQLYKPFSGLDLATERLYRAAPLLRYHDNWKFLRPAQALSRIQYDVIIPEKGYYEKDDILSAEVADYMRYDSGMTPIPAESQAAVRRLRDLCQQAGSSLLLLSAPSAANWDYCSHNAVEALAMELGIPYVDMNLENVSIDWTQDTPDAGDHLNASGAPKASRWLGNYLSQTGLFE